MPLSAATLQDAILCITDRTHPGWGGWPADAAAVRTRWAAAARTYFEDLAAPVVVPGTHATAEAAMRAAMAAPTPAALITGLQAYAAAIVAGAAAAGVTATPPLPPLPAVPSVPTNDPVPPATAFAASVHAWACTGTWTIGAPPAPWS